MTSARAHNLEENQLLANTTQKPPCFLISHSIAIVWNSVGWCDPGWSGQGKCGFRAFHLCFNHSSSELISFILGSHLGLYFAAKKNWKQQSRCSQNSLHFQISIFLLFYTVYKLTSTAIPNIEDRPGEEESEKYQLMQICTDQALS